MEFLNYFWDTAAELDPKARVGRNYDRRFRHFWLAG